MLKRILFAILLLLVFSGSGLGTFYGLMYWTSLVPAKNQFQGHAFFVSGGQLNESNVQGNNDELQIDLHSLPDPAPGKSYYAWLLGDNNQNSFPTSILAGTLSITHGDVQFHYNGTPQHENLIGITSRLLITEEKANMVPVRPTGDRSMWRYYAELPQTTGQGTQQPTALECLRALLYEEPTISKLGIHGGLSIQLLKNTGKILEWIYSARGSSDASFRHREIVRTLDYLDGLANVQLDTPPGTPVLADNVLAQVPLIDSVPNQAQGSYLDLIEAQLSHLVAAPGVTPSTRTLALQVQRALSGNTQSLFGLVRQAAKVFVAIPEGQLLTPTAQSLLDDMVALSNAIFVGKLDPATNELQPGVVQIFYDIQHLASYDLKPLSSQA